MMDHAWGWIILRLPLNYRNSLSNIIVSPLFSKLNNILRSEIFLYL